MNTAPPKVLPHSQDAEYALVYALLVEPKETLKAAGSLSPSAFYNVEVAELWRAALRLNAQGKGIDPATLIDGSNGAGELVRAGINKALASFGSSSLAGEYVGTITQQWKRRRLIETAGLLAESAYNPDTDLDGIFEDVRRELDHVATDDNEQPVLTLGELKPCRSDDPHVLAGDRWLCRGGAVLIAAPTGIGKSALVMQFAILWGLGRPVFGIKPRGELRSLIVQAENDHGDLCDMRDGVFRGLSLSEEDQAKISTRVLMVQECVRTGAAFASLLDRLIGEHNPDVVVIDPLLAFLGDDVKEQRALSPFLRNLLNPLLIRHNCGLLLVHHTNKPTQGKEKLAWQAGDFAYLGSGSAEIANWARGVVALRSVGSHDVFEVVLGKRGKRAGLVNEQGEHCFSFFVKHSQTGICWLPATEDDLPDQDSGRQTIPSAAVAETIGEGLLQYSALVEILAKEYDVSTRTARRAVDRARDNGRVHRTASGFYERTRKK